MIEFVTGDFFDYNADIRINTVNCVGVMGAGVALEFKTRYPEMFKAYVEVCKNDKIAPGIPFLWEEYDLFSTCTIINLPTKIHWRNPSEYEYIEKDLIWLREFLEDKGSDVVVTLPALGCGHGGLNWDIVRNKICHYLQGISAKILVFEPSSSNKKIHNLNYGIELRDTGIETIYQVDSEYPIKFKEVLKREIYCKGNKNLLKSRIISLICSNTVNEREISTILKVLEEIEHKNFVLLIGLNNKKHVHLSKVLLEHGYSLILLIPYGILNYKLGKEFTEFKDNYAVISYVNPEQEFKRYEYLNSLKTRLAVADVILYCSDDCENIKKSYRYLKGYNNLFYINFWHESIEEFLYLQARKIGVNAETRKPNVLGLQQYLDLTEKK